MYAPPPPPPFNGHPPAAGDHSPWTPSSALTAFTDLLQLTNSTLRSLPAPLPTFAASPSLLPCPLNPNHRLHPSSLFSHFLRCPSPITLPPLRYPLTLHASTTSAATSINQLDPSADLCLSLENFLDCTNFFYLNCPGVITLTNNETSASAISPPMLTLPGFLSIECGNFNNHPLELMNFSVKSIRLLPSEIWAIGKEMDAWSDFPTGYSYRILRSILRLRDDKLLQFREWIVGESLKCGVVIDFAMRDHMVLLFRLCLKAIVREAFGLVGSLFSGEEAKMEDQVSGSNKGSFSCPVLVKVLMWLASQLAILYGEANGKLFAINLLKKCVLDSSSSGSLFPLEQKATKSSYLQNVEDEMKESQGSGISVVNSEESERNNNELETIGSSTVFVSQVAAAVAALHERSMIERRIKALRPSRTLSTYQRNVEHAHVSQKADEERKSRSEYKPILEHEGLLWQRSHNHQDTNKAKTKEELLAEERDYKRRRMSYRGKKLKRSNIEVMRDIIEEYMEEIKSSGGIGHVGKAIADAETLPSEKISVQDRSTGNSDTRKNLPETVEGSGGRSHSYRKELHTRDNSKDFEDDNENRRRESKRHYRHQDFNSGIEKSKHHRDNYSRSLDTRNSSSNLLEQTCRGKRGYVEVSGEGSPRSSDRSHNKSQDRGNKRERDDRSSEHREQRRSKIIKSSRFDYNSANEFMDRYDPSQ